MPIRDEWLALAERCERAEGPDRELNEALADACGHSHFFEVLTEPIDVAMAVVEGRFGRSWKLECRSNEAGMRFVFAEVSRKSGHSYTSTARALMAAYCRARAEEETT